MISTRTTALPQFIEHKLRHRLWWLHPILLLVALQPRRFIIYITLGYLCFLALKDYFTLIPTKRMDRVTLLIGYLSIPVIIFLAATERFGLFATALPALVFAGLTLYVARWQKRKRMRQTLGPLFWGMTLFMFGLGNLALLLLTPSPVAPSAIARGDALYLILLVQVAGVVLLGLNSGLLFFVSPRLQPWVSTIGVGLATAVFAVILSPLLLLLPTGQAFGLGATIGTAVYAGQSLVCDLQDSFGVPPQLAKLPGYGGVMLQIAGYSFAAPLYLHVMTHWFTG